MISNMKDCKIRIDVSRGSFKTVATAARSEKKVKWFVPDTDADAVTECYAAVELRNGIRTLCRNADRTDAAVSFVVPGGKLRSACLQIVLGTPSSNPRVAALQDAGGMRGGSHSEGYLIPARREARTRILYIAALTRNGVLNGVYRYLEELGLGWTSPDRIQAAWPKRVVFWKEALHLTEAPRFESRGFYIGSARHPVTEDLLVWMARNRMNYCTWPSTHPALAKKLGIGIMAGGDELHLKFDPDHIFKKGKTLYEAHPEWFALRNGRRDPWPGVICLSNRAAVNYLFEQIMAFVMQHAAWLDVYAFGGSDTGKTWCECRACKKMGNAADRYLRLVHEMRRRLDAEYEKGNIDHRIILRFEAYDCNDSLQPPSRPFPKGFDMETTQLEIWPIRRCQAHPIDDPECRELNLLHWRAIQGWHRKFKGRIIQGEFYNVSALADMATVFSKTMAADVRTYAAGGVSGMQYMHVSPGHWGPRSLTNWQLARLLWDPGHDYDSMLRQFFRLRFGPVARQAERLYRKLDLATSNIMMIKSVVAGNLNWNLRRNYGDYAAVEWDNAGGLPMLELFDFDHLSLHRPADSDGRIGNGLNNLDDIVKAFEDIAAGFRGLRKQRNLPAAAKANLDEDLTLVTYTGLLIELHYQFALCWEANRYGNRQPGPHKARLLRIAARLDRFAFPQAAMGASRVANALERTNLSAPLKRAFEYGGDGEIARQEANPGVII